ncbi:MAG: phosphodiesterase [Actinomycetota bacterium]
MVRLAQITDTHVLDPARDDVAFVDNNARLAEAVAGLNAEHPRPEVVLATGDMTNDGHPGELDQLTDLLAPLEIPLLILPGNHDHRPSFRARFAMDWAADDHLSWVAPVGDLTVIGLDATVDDGNHGDYTDGHDAWLSRTLAAIGDAPCAIALHHPPYVSGIAFMDRSTLRNGDRFLATVARHPNVLRVVCGHLHRPTVVSMAGVTVSSCLSTVQSPALMLGPEDPVALIRDPAGYHLHHVDTDRGLWLTHTRYIATGEQPIFP